MSGASLSGSRCSRRCSSCSPCSSLSISRSTSSCRRGRSKPSSGIRRPMEALGLLLYGFKVLLTWKILALMMVGLVLGIFVGVLPGLGGPNGVAILLPLTFTMDPTSAVVMLSCLYWCPLFRGPITSILFNIPGEAWSVATTFDGYPLAQQGR